MSRMVGGTFGVAVMGALIATLGRRRSTTASRRSQPIPAERSPTSLGGGGGSGHGLPANVVSAVHEAFVSALGTGLTISAALTLGAAVLAWILIAPRVVATEPVEPEPAEHPEETPAPE